MFDLNKGKTLKLPCLSDGATELKYRKSGFATLLNLVAFSRAIEDKVCTVTKGEHVFYVTPSFKLPRRRISFEPDEIIFSKLSLGFKTIISLQNIKGIDKISLGHLKESNHLPGYMTIPMILYLNPKIEAL